VVDRRGMNMTVMEELAEIMPRAVGSQVRWFSPYPFFVEKAERAWVTDVDRNQYIDYLMG